MARLKSARHHWWPEGVSDFWKDDAGRVCWLLPDGTVKHFPPKNFGVIVGGHQIKMGAHPDDDKVWGDDFEHEFQDADSNFPGLIRWLQDLERRGFEVLDRRQRFLPQVASSEQVSILIECLVSLAVRSPMNREAAVSLAERLRGPLPPKERNTLIGLNMRHEYRRAVEAFGTRGKIVVIYSPDKEFIFGDGFYHNLTSPSGAPPMPRILVPLTPEISVLYAIPAQYSAEPQLSTLVVDAAEAAMLNDVVQVYAREALFYRAEKPTITESYRKRQHLVCIPPGDPIEHIIADVAGIT